MRNTLRTLTLFTRSLGFHSFLSTEQITENIQVEDGGKGVWWVGGPRATVQTQGRERREIGKGGGGRIHYEICL